MDTKLNYVLRSLFITAFLACACDFRPKLTPRQKPSSANDKSSQGKTFDFEDGTTMRVREQTGEFLRGIHLVRKTAEGGVETTDAETGRITEGTNRRVMRITLYDAHVDLGPKGRFVVEQLTMELIKPLDAASLEQMARDARQRRLTNKIQGTGK